MIFSYLPVSIKIIFIFYGIFIVFKLAHRSKNPESKAMITSDLNLWTRLMTLEYKIIPSLVGMVFFFCKNLCLKKKMPFSSIYNNHNTQLKN